MSIFRSRMQWHASYHAAIFPSFCRSLDGGESSGSSNDDEEDVVNDRKFQAITCTGCQPGSSVFVFGPTLHINEKGDRLPREQQEYVWVPRILQYLHQVVNPLTALPNSGDDNPLQYVVQGLQSIAGDNVLSGVFLLGRCIPFFCGGGGDICTRIFTQLPASLQHKCGHIICNLYLPIGAAIISLYYDVMLQRFQIVGVHVAVSSISRGKTNCAKVVLAIVGNYPKGYTI